MNNIDEKIVHEAFEKSGYTIECMSPLEVSYDENFAKHCFAQIVIDNRIKEILLTIISCKIDEWHLRDQESLTLHDFLGFSWEEYQLYAQKNTIPDHKQEYYLKLFINNPEKYLDYL